jgi:hypothetical protein
MMNPGNNCSRSFQRVLIISPKLCSSREISMKYTTITFALILMLFLSPAAQLVNAQDNESEPITGTNSTIPDPLVGVNNTETNFTITDTNTTDVNSTEPIDPAILEMIREQAHNRTREMLELFGDGNYSSEIMNGLAHAQQAMEQAQSMEGNNTRAAAQQYLRAMTQYRNTLRKYMKDNPDVIELFDEPDVNETATDDVNGTITEEEVNSTKTQLITQFQERFREHVSAMIQNVEDVSDTMSPQDAYKTQQALTKAEQKLLRIQERIESGQYDDALDDLDNTTETLNREFDAVEDPGTAQMLRTMNKLEAKIQKMEQIAAKKAEKGISTDMEDALLSELRGNKNKEKNDFKENKGNSGEKSTGKPDKDTGKPDIDKSNKGKGN